MDTEKLPYDQLIDMLASGREKVQPGSKWQHYKGNEYIVEKIVLIEATNEVSVLYSSVAHPQVPYVRPITSWLQTVEWNGQELARFTPVA